MVRNRTGPSVADPVRFGPCSEAFREYLELSPADVSTALRLYVAYGLAAAALGAAPGRFRGMAPFVLGRTVLRVRSHGLLFAARPRSEDLGYLRPSLKRTVERWFRPRRGDRVVDAGAHIGFHSLRAAAHGARVLAIEPNPEAAATARLSAAWNGLSNLTVVNVAVGGFRATADLEVPDTWDGKSSLVPGWASGGRDLPRKTIRVEVIPLDELLASEPRTPVDWLLVDVEGFEREVLRGAEVTLLRTRNLLLETSEATHDECRRLVEGTHGFEVLAVERQTEHTRYLVARRPAPERARRPAGDAT